MTFKIFLLVTSLLGIKIYALVTTQLTSNDLVKGTSYQKYFSEVSSTFFFGGYFEKTPKKTATRPFHDRLLLRPQSFFALGTRLLMHRPG